MQALFETKELKKSTTTMKSFLENYAELRELVSKSKSMTKKEKTDTLNKNDDSLKIMCDSYFNTVLHALLTTHPFEIKVKDKEGVEVARDFWNWYQYIPASTKYHDTENGGLYHHCQKQFYNWLKSLLQMKCDYPVEKACLISLAHDFCKTTHYYYDYADNQWHNNYPETYHHATKSLEIAKQIGLDVTPDVEALILMHMSGYQNLEDKMAMSDDAKKWLFDLDHMQILQLLNCADCK